jgi:hypothetical protein
MLKTSQVNSRLGRPERLTYAHIFALNANYPPLCRRTAPPQSRARPGQWRNMALDRRHRSLCGDAGVRLQSVEFEHCQSAAVFEFFHHHRFRAGRASESQSLGCYAESGPSYTHRRAAELRPYLQILLDNGADSPCMAKLVETAGIHWEKTMRRPERSVNYLSSRALDLDTRDIDIMAKLNADARKKLPATVFAEPKSEPIRWRIRRTRAT